MPDSSYTLIIICAFAVSLVLGLVTIPVILDFCKAKHLYDQPGGRHVHRNPVPRLGGAAFLPSMLLTLIIALMAIGHRSISRMIELNIGSVFFLAGLLIVYIVGIVDDLVGLKPAVKFVSQLIAACLLPAAGLYINNLYGLLGIYTIPWAAGAPLTVFLVVFICNALNLIDGIDGLCAGITEIALGGFLILFFQSRMPAYCIVITGLMGVLAAYLWFNLFGSPDRNRKIFMGDSGSLTLGFTLAFLFVKASMNVPDKIPYDPLRMPFACSLLVIPTFDVVRVVAHRLRIRQNIFKGDKCHVHHKLMACGLSMRQTLLVLLALDLLFIGMNGFLYPLFAFTGTVIADIIVYALFIGTIDLIRHETAL